jgi:hypothetical protein
MNDSVLPRLLLLTNLQTIDAQYAYVGVYTAAAGDPPDTARLSLLYSLKGMRERVDEEALHYAEFAALINDYWAMPSGSYQMVAGVAPSDFPEVVANLFFYRSLTHEDQLPGFEPEDSPLMELAKRWRKYVGDDLAADTSPQALGSGILTVAVKSKMAGQSLGFLVKGIIERAASEFPAAHIDKVRIRHIAQPEAETP